MQLTLYLELCRKHWMHTSSLSRANITNYLYHLPLIAIPIYHSTHCSVAQLIEIHPLYLCVCIAEDKGEKPLSQSADGEIP